MSYQTLVLQNERDTIEVFTYLKKEDEKKQDEVDVKKNSSYHPFKIKYLKNELNTTLEHHEFEKKKLVCTYAILLINFHVLTTKIEEMEQSMCIIEDNMTKKKNELLVLQKNFVDFEEYQQDKENLEMAVRTLEKKCLDENESKAAMVEQLELKFFEEKMRLRQESIQNITYLAEEAHKSALLNLNSSVKAVYKQNMDMRLLLHHFKHQLNEFSATSTILKEENQSLLLDKALCEKMILQQSEALKVLNSQSARQAAQIEQLKLDLQQEQENRIKQKEEAEQHIVNCSSDSIKSAEQLYKALILERKRANRVYTLAQHILKQRSEVESFFLAALDQVRDEIALTQKKYSMDAKAAYETRMRLAYYGADEYPQVRTFHRDETTICENIKTAAEA
ncbi:hypothetical protein AHF37_08604 [Paragonimus kellicotti]|nr:hypothetical protein AHF37_08604 [Paragonimus kellicotti]